MFIGFGNAYRGIIRAGTGGDIGAGIGSASGAAAGGVVGVAAATGCNVLAVACFLVATFAGATAGAVAGRATGEWFFDPRSTVGDTGRGPTYFYARYLEAQQSLWR